MLNLQGAQARLNCRRAGRWASERAVSLGLRRIGQQCEGSGKKYRSRMHIESVAIIVDDYDEAIAFFVDALGFELVEDSPALTNDGRPKRWVIIRPPGASTAVLLVQADGDRQSAAVGDQAAGRVGFFLRVDDFDHSYRRMVEHGVRFLSEPREESYGTVAVFLDISGNKWDLLG